MRSSAFFDHKQKRNLVADRKARQCCYTTSELRPCAFHRRRVLLVLTIPIFHRSKHLEDPSFTNMMKGLVLLRASKKLCDSMLHVLEQDDDISKSDHPVRKCINRWANIAHSGISSGTVFRQLLKQAHSVGDAQAAAVLKRLLAADATPRLETYFSRELASVVSAVIEVLQSRPPAPCAKRPPAHRAEVVAADRPTPPSPPPRHNLTSRLVTPPRHSRVPTPDASSSQQTLNARVAPPKVRAPTSAVPRVAIGRLEGSTGSDRQSSNGVGDVATSEEVGQQQAVTEVSVQCDRLFTGVSVGVQVEEASMVGCVSQVRAALVFYIYSVLYCTREAWNGVR